MPLKEGPELHCTSSTNSIIATNNSYGTTHVQINPQVSDANTKKHKKLPNTRLSAVSKIDSYGPALATSMHNATTVTILAGRYLPPNFLVPSFI
jgi:hypothetical protein